VAIGALEHLRSQIVGRSADGTLAFTLVKYLSSEAEIADFKLHALSQEEIAQFEISMDHVLFMHVLDAATQLMDVVAGLDFGEALASAHKVRKGLVMANVKHYVDVLPIFEVSVKSHYVLVTERSVDFDLTRELLTGF